MKYSIFSFDVLKVWTEGVELQVSAETKRCSCEKQYNYLEIPVFPLNLFLSMHPIPILSTPNSCDMALILRCWALPSSG